MSSQENYMPPVTFIVVQKRHHTRFFPARHGDRQSTDKSGNILPRTVVDAKFVIQQNLVSMWYSGNKSSNALSCVVFQICLHCTLAYYAHLVAFRARYYMEGEFSDSESHGQRATTERIAEARHVL
ncbi:Ribonuclease H-like domain-containing protein [Cynara cardunculus var. scolymus]|uniref:Ribonuclease H-like domain-containing protein n=1 Tax=Cynara cardunculus var. scolymus TaxID=59895 RepID=A0A103YFJ9_CYNCS|nr:Ribonuclease H-like domain-containing protein [Cynara cardunculus var. scolymus]